MKSAEIATCTFSRGLKQPSMQRYPIYLVVIINDFNI